MATTKATRKATFRKELKQLAEKNKLTVSSYSEEQLFEKLARLRREKKLKGVTDWQYLQSICALWWVNETF